MHSLIRPNTYIALRLPSETLKVLRIVPNTTVSIGKYGSFQANHILGRPYHLTFEILDKGEDQTKTDLRIVPASELNAEGVDESTSTPVEVSTPDKVIDGGDGVQYDLVGASGEVLMRTNRETVDVPGRQTMSMDEIEALKKEGTGAGKDLIARILLSHSALDQKTTFSLAKYTLRKTRKYLRRFTVLPLDVPTLAHWMMSEKEPMKVLELREEMLALIGSWANARCSSESQTCETDSDMGDTGVGRWLLVDETGGLVVAALAERMGILCPPEENDDSDTDPLPRNGDSGSDVEIVVDTSKQSETTSSHHHHNTSAMSAKSNTLTLVHANAQPNLSLLSYFLFDASNSSPAHPLHAHLKTLSWLQLLSPYEDVGYTEPEVVDRQILKTWKSGKRGTYHRKRRRWERIKAVVDETRAGGFDGLVVASAMNPATILQHTVPLLRGGAQVVVYSPTIEPLAELADYYSTARRTAFLSNPPDPSEVPIEDFSLNPTLLLAPTVQTARLRNWQVLPGRTHPLMTGRGGAEGYLFTATRVLPAEGRVEARGKFQKRKLEKEAGPNNTAQNDTQKNLQESFPAPAIGMLKRKLEEEVEANNKVQDNSLKPVHDAFSESASGRSKKKKLEEEVEAGNTVQHYSQKQSQDTFIGSSERSNGYKEPT
ncbi:MAG: tRNA (adenine(58)-N(1))-methyltransferase non-catalytic subunit trm6 [Pleopsidium flavum]|nr:MAG: tRNA (adenine(58)-N(1))-methyltransferase non-catalytic subunit trm6 [Pleopsidium flavum]